MSITIDATSGGASANSYVTVSEYTAYWDGKSIPAGQISPLADGDDDRVKTALVDACRWLDQDQYLGRKLTQAQALKFPRGAMFNGPVYGVFGYGGLSDDEGYPVDSTTVPQQVKDAQCELAYALIQNPALFDGEPLSRFERLVINRGAVDVTPRHGAYQYIPAKVERLLRYLRVGGQARAIRG